MKGLLQWWNVIYWVPLCLSLLWILMTAVAGLGDGGDAGSGGDASADSTSTDMDHDVSGHDGADGDHDTDHGDGHDHNTAAELMGLLGLGRVPITLLLGIYSLFWGTIGLLVNSLCTDAGLLPTVFVLPSLVGTLMITFIVTRLSVGIIAKCMPGTESFAITARHLIGREGKVVYPVTETGGTVQVADAYGTVHRRMAKTETGGTPLASGSAILVVGLDDMEDRLVVKQYCVTAGKI